MQLEDQIKNTIRDVPDYPRPGIIFKDITPVLADATLTRKIVVRLADPFRDLGIGAVAGIEARGFILGALLAQELGCGFVPVRKSGKLPFNTRRQRYDLEYGSAEIEMHTDAVKPGTRVLLHDDLLATGGTALAAAKLIADLGAEVGALSFLINLSFLPGERILREQLGVSPDFLVKY